MRSAVTVHCENCGSDAWLTALTVALAATSLLVAVVALWIARRQLRMDHESHTDLAASVSLAGSEDFTLDAADALRDHVLIIGLSNHGERVATNVWLTVLVPADVSIDWVATWGNAHGAHKSLSDDLMAGDGVTQAHAVWRELPTVPRSGTTMQVRIRPSRAVAFPIQVRIRCALQPPDRELVTVDRTVEFREAPNSAV